MLVFSIDMLEDTKSDQIMTFAINLNVSLFASKCTCLHYMIDRQWRTSFITNFHKITKNFIVCLCDVSKLALGN